MSEDTAQTAGWKAPYLSYDTLTNFFEKRIGDNPLPPRIDNHFLDNYGGSVRPLLVSALKTIGLIGENNEVLEPLRDAVRSPEERRRVLREWAEVFYSEQLDLARRHATAQMLWESFAKQKYTGSTLRKAVVFYLALVADLDLPTSAHFRPPKVIVANKNGKGTRAAERPTSVPPAPEPPPAATTRVGGEERVVDFGRAGTVRITVDVKWLDLPDETFTQLRRLVRELTELGEDVGSEPSTEAEV